MKLLIYAHIGFVKWYVSSISVDRIKMNGTHSMRVAKLSNSNIVSYRFTPLMYTYINKRDYICAKEGRFVSKRTSKPIAIVNWCNSPVASRHRG